MEKSDRVANVDSKDIIEIADRVDVNTSIPYETVIGNGLLKKAGELISEVKSPSKAVIICDDNVDRLYGNIVLDSLNREGVHSFKFVLPNGEKSKSLLQAEKILQFLINNNISKSDILISLGGGVVGDITGFCASIYMRGISFIQIPTTVLAAVDSSVGGKTAVNFGEIKNSIGTFWQPSLVICDTDTFQTLDESVYMDGVCEVIKYGCILDRQLFEDLKRGKCKENINSIVARCIKIKADVVKQDEFDGNIRNLLNFGHTIGHAIESLSNYEVSHGNAVAIGMYMIEKARKNGFDKDIKELLNIYGIDINVNAKLNSTLRLNGNPSESLNGGYNSADIIDRIRSDKKIKDDKINLIVLEKIGKAKIEKISLEEMAELIENKQ